MRKLLEKLYVLQTVSNRNRVSKLGRGFNKAYRFNPYNPLSYLVIVLAVVIGILLFGFVGIWKETDVVNPFKWR